MRTAAVEIARELVAVTPARGSHRAALRAGVSVFVPLVVVWAWGHDEWSMGAVFGAFAALYGRDQAGVWRLRMQASAGVVQVVAVLLGAVAATLPGREAWSIAAAAVMAVGATVISDSARWHPPGPLWAVFAAGACSNHPHPPSAVVGIVAVAAASAAFAVAVGAAGRVVRRIAQPAAVGHVPAPTRWSLTVHPHALVVGVGVVLAGLVGGAVGEHAYWAMVAAVVPLAVRPRRGQVVRGLLRVIGTAIGLVIALPLLALHLDGLGLLVVIAALQVAAELAIGRNYALAMACVTPLALLVGNTVAPQPPMGLMVDRWWETVAGVGVGGLVAAVGASVLARTGHADHAGHAGHADRPTSARG